MPRGLRGKEKNLFLRTTLHRIVHFASVRAENLPLSGAQPLENRLSLLGADGRVRIHRGHQDGRILIVAGLFLGEAVDVDVHVAGERDTAFIVNQDDLSRQMPALPFVNLKMQIAEIEHADLTERNLLLPAVSPQREDLFRLGRAIACQRLADVDIGPVQGVPLPEAVLPLILRFQAVRAFPAGQHPVEQRQQTAVIHIRVGDEHRLFHGVIVRQEAAEDGFHLLPIAGVARVDHQRPVAMSQDGRVATAGRLDQRQLRGLRQAVRGDPGREGRSPIGGQHLRKAANAVKGPVRG